MKRLPKICCNRQIAFSFFTYKALLRIYVIKVEHAKKKCRIHYSIRRVIKQNCYISTFTKKRRYLQARFAKSKTVETIYTVFKLGDTLELFLLLKH